MRGLPFAVTMIIVSPRAPKLAAKIGAKRAVGGGMIVLAVGLTLMSFVTLATNYWYVALCLVLAAAGVGAAMPSLSSGIVQSVPMNKAGVGSAVNDTTREVGGAIGIAALGSIVNSIYRRSPRRGARRPPARGEGGGQPQRGRRAARRGRSLPTRGSGGGQQVRHACSNRSSTACTSRCVSRRSSSWHGALVVGAPLSPMASSMLPAAH